MQYPVAVHQIETEKGYEWIAEFPDVKGCVGGGDTPEEAVCEAYENLEIHLEFLREEGLPIPMVSNNSIKSYNGKISLRVSKSLHESLSKCAEEEGISNNQFIVEAIAEKVGKEKAITSLQKAITRIENTITLKYNSDIRFNLKDNAIKLKQGGGYNVPKFQH